MKTLLPGLLLLACAVSEAIAAEPPTFSNQVVRIFQQHCQTCHHAGAIAPFSLTSYQDAYPWRAQIREATRTRKMPPWKPVHGFGDFADVRRLSESEVALIERWVAAGAPEGEQTTDEMCIAFLRVTVDAERLNHQPR